jgi:hypothetical protein
LESGNDPQEPNNTHQHRTTGLGASCSSGSIGGQWANAQGMGNRHNQGSSRGEAMNTHMQFRARIVCALLLAGLAIGCLINW